LLHITLSKERHRTATGPDLTIKPWDQTPSGAFDGTLGVVAGAASFAGPDAAAARIGEVTAGGFAVHVEEDLSLNAELTHRAEDIHWLAWSGAGDIWGDAIA
jgi:hypothetical protein